MRPGGGGARDSEGEEPENLRPGGGGARNSARRRSQKLWDQKGEELRGGGATESGIQEGEEPETLRPARNHINPIVAGAGRQAAAQSQCWTDFSLDSGFLLSSFSSLFFPPFFFHSFFFLLSAET